MLNTFFRSNGNKLTNSGRLYEFYTNTSLINSQFSIDYFGGLILGNFPFHNDILYNSDVADIKLQLSSNITINLKFEFFELAQYHIQFQLVPFSATLALDMYSTVVTGDNCAWI